MLVKHRDSMCAQVRLRVGARTPARKGLLLPEPGYSESALKPKPYRFKIYKVFSTLRSWYPCHSHTYAWTFTLPATWKGHVTRLDMSSGSY